MVIRRGERKVMLNELHVGLKVIHATPMTRERYNEYRGWELPADEEGSDAGYLVEYADGGQANHANHAGYISWSPTAVFNNAYKPQGKLGFPEALELVKRGSKVARAGWNDIFIFLVPGSIFEVNRPPLLGIYPEGTTISYHSHIDMKTAQGTVVPWLCSQTDMLANDWGIVE